jgi:hypothetical protein
MPSTPPQPGAQSSIHLQETSLSLGNIWQNRNLIPTVLNPLPHNQILYHRLATLLYPSQSGGSGGYLYPNKQPSTGYGVERAEHGILGKVFRDHVYNDANIGH